VQLHELLAGFDDVDVTVGRDGERDVEVSHVVHDSRDVTAGALFCCIPGATADGHDFAPAAVAAGAVACLVERPVAVDVPQARVPSVRAVLGPLASRFHGDPSRSLPVLGVTGTNGKTTTTYLLERIGEVAGEPTGLLGTTGARVAGTAIELRHTTPEATDLQRVLAQMRDAGARMVAMEVSSHALDQHRVDGTLFAAVCFTNLSHDHLDYHVDMESYFDAKARLFTREFASAGAVNLDDAHGVALVDRARAEGLEILTYAVTAPADVRAIDIRATAAGTSFTIVDRGEKLDVVSTLVGGFNVANALAAYATARLAGMPGEAIVRGLSTELVVPGRMERVDHAGPFAVLVDYAHTPDALAAALASARSIVEDSGKVIVVFGCGGDRDRAKRPLMGRVAVDGSDLAILTSDNPRSEDPAAIAADVCNGAQPGVVELDRRSAIRAALHAARTGDVVLIAGKGHESGQLVKDKVLDFDDRHVAREELEAFA
jgi:UDP-N-acetylmuramoyl-L-alanyl-D-glutamate--2,6-diaminopimelate ligase